ncbi:MAG TPA: single-stranded DNA-binding protein [Kribbella sp.]|uniref:single-stranded DNA-binding protein n=1 Tax=Kribbella sp. TaxID=1871183 RepID=UPI002D7802CA|nr:single-stranded DNA-binding protein [Kribbella sp.]HET6296720.1 single-stranded DNA-binding protein [Kribbella sp.]
MSVGETYLTVQGWVGGDVQFKEVAGGVALASFRLGSTPRQYDRAKGSWVDRPTTWYTVECWRTLAQNVFDSVYRGQPVVVSGRLKTTEWTEEGGETRQRTVLDAFSVGHDLTRGTAKFAKNARQALAVAGDSLDQEMRDLSPRAETSGPVGDDFYLPDEFASDAGQPTPVGAATPAGESTGSDQEQDAERQAA